MKKIIRLSILFSLPILIVLISFEILLRNIPNDFDYKKKYLDANSNRIKVLFLGSSHIYYGANPVYTKLKSFNSSHISQSLNYDFSILNKYEKKWDNLKYIIVPVDYFSMYYTLETGVEKWRIKNYNIYYGINHGEDYSYNFEIATGKFLNNIKRLKNSLLHRGSDITCNSLGWGNTYHSTDSQDLFETGITAAKRHTMIKDDMIFSKNIEAIKNILYFSKQNEIKILFVTTPAYKTYVENLDKSQLNHMISTISGIVSKHSNAKYYNLLNDKKFKDSDFYDADHLNERGAKRFTLLMDSLIGIE